VQLLQEALLSRTDISTLAPTSPLLAARLADKSDLVATILTCLASGDPAAVWPLLATDAAKRDPRHAELSVRVMEAAFQRGCDVDLDAWYATVAGVVYGGAIVERQAFRKLTLESQMELCEPIVLTALEAADARDAAGAAQLPDDAPEVAAAIAASQLQAQRRDAAARILQLRLPAHLAKLHERRTAAAQLRSNQAWLARACTLRAAVRARATMAATVAVPPCAAAAAAVVQPLAQAAQLAHRSGSWLLLLNAVAQAWDVLRAIVITPDVLAPVPSATWLPRQDGVDGEGMLLWQCRAAPPSLARALTSIVLPLLDFLDRLRSGDTCVYPALYPLQPKGPPVSPTTPSNPCPGSDAPSHFWYRDCPQIDFPWLNIVLSASVATLTACGHPATALAIGHTWASLSCGAFNDTLLPLQISASYRAAADPQPISTALAAVLRDKKQVLCKLHALRTAAQDAIGTTPPLATTPRGKGGKPELCGDVSSQSCRSHATHTTPASVWLPVRHFPIVASAASLHVADEPSISLWPPRQVRQIIRGQWSNTYSEHGKSEQTCILESSNPLKD
jgi:hypothetical protein